MKLILGLVVFPSQLILSGCGGFTPRDVVSEPGNVTLEHAMVDTGRGLVALKKELAGKYKTGLIVDELTATYNVSAQSTQNNKLVLDAKLPAPTVAIPAQGGLSYTLDNTAQASRGNQVVVRFKSVYTGEMNDVFYWDQRIPRSARAAPKTAQASPTKPEAKPQGSVAGASEKPPVDVADCRIGVEIMTATPSAQQCSRARKCGPERGYADILKKCPVTQ